MILSKLLLIPITLYIILVYLENASRHCSSAGEWEDLTDYSHCKKLCMETDSVNQTTKYIDCSLETLSDTDTEISVHVYFVGELLA